MEVNVNHIAPGVDLDTLIARYIFGWTEAKTATNDWFDNCVRLWRPTPQDKGVTPSWSRYPSHTLLVARQMETEGYQMAIYNSKIIEDKPGTYEVTFIKGTDGQAGKARADFCTAVCRAALNTR